MEVVAIPGRADRHFCLDRFFFGSISLSFLFAVHSLSGAENRTRDGWVGSANASSVLCRPPIVSKSFYLHLKPKNRYHVTRSGDITALIKRIPWALLST